MMCMQVQASNQKTIHAQVSVIHAPLPVLSLLATAHWGVVAAAHAVGDTPQGGLGWAADTPTATHQPLTPYNMGQGTQHTSAAADENTCCISLLSGHLAETTSDGSNTQ